MKKQKGAPKGARLGQHFLTAKWAAVKLATAAIKNEDDIVLEIGPGKGFLTKELLILSNRVIAIEKDTALVDILNAKFVGEVASGQLTIINDDIRSVDLRSLGLKNHEYVLAANIPYYITGEIIRTFLESNVQPHTIAILIQKEVAERIATDKKESILSLSVKAYGNPKMIAKVGKGSFSPPPSVDSAILVVEKITRDFFDYSPAITEDHFFKVVKAGFAAKRKILLGNLSALFEKEKVLMVFANNTIDLKVRAEDVSLSTWREIVVGLS